MLDIFYFLYFLVYLPVLLWRGKGHGGFTQRFGFFPLELTAELSGGRNIWVHAVSVGEVALVDGIIRGLKEKYKDHRIVLSVTTKTGHGFALKKYSTGVKVIWAPLDLSWSVDRFFKVIHPAAYVVAETELWPNLFARLGREGVPIYLVNGRVSDEAYPRYRMARWLLKRTVLGARLLCVQTSLDAQRFMDLGAIQSQIRVVGNVKFDVPVPLSMGSRQDAKKEFGFSASDRLFVAASTHPGEEAAVCQAYCLLRSKFPGLRLAIVPRHPERAKEVVNIARQYGLASALYSRAADIPLAGSDVLIVDAVGHLIDLYLAADVVFTGKSLGPLRRGGQNPIEPAALGRPVIVGPHTENFRDVMRAFREAGAVIEISDARGLGPAVDDVLSHPQRMAGLCVRAKIVVDQNRGAAQRTVALIEI